MCLNLLFFGTFPLRITIAESADLGNPNHLEVVSKPRIRFKGKAQADRESAAYMGM
jgi:hypothetical protein